ncbi:SymE family type I addiction module toxin [Rahnella inusitata]|uniref:SymE family type I addiction module toxin n=1 Tax=Rahnella inusitata TaxID=58169 RepID=UPI0039B110DC
MQQHLNPADQSTIKRNRKMANTDSKSNTAPLKPLRHYIVGYVPNPYRHPQICVKGKWLEEAGFSTGMPVTIRVMKGCLVITTQPQEKDIQEFLQPARELSAQSQNELMQMINGLVLKDKLLHPEGV